VSSRVDPALDGSDKPSGKDNMGAPYNLAANFATDYVPAPETLATLTDTTSTEFSL
jgi:hypothetical protein